MSTVNTTGNETIKKTSGAQAFNCLYCLTWLCISNVIGYILAYVDIVLFFFIVSFPVVLTVLTYYLFCFFFSCLIMTKEMSKHVANKSGLNVFFAVSEVVNYDEDSSTNVLYTVMSRVMPHPLCTAYPLYTALSTKILRINI